MGNIHGITFDLNKNIIIIIVLYTGALPLPIDELCLLDIVLAPKMRLCKEFSTMRKPVRYVCASDAMHNVHDMGVLSRIVEICNYGCNHRPADGIRLSDCKSKARIFNGLHSCRLCQQYQKYVKDHVIFCCRIDTNGNIIIGQTCHAYRMAGMYECYTNNVREDAIDEATIIQLLRSQVATVTQKEVQHTSYRCNHAPTRTHTQTHTPTYTPNVKQTHTDIHTFVHTHTQTHTHHTYTHTNRHTHTHTHTHTHRHTHTCTHTRTDTHRHTHRHTHAHTNTNKHTHTHTDTHTHTHMHTHAHTH